ncbi:hypothetical protein D8674_011500 [Pyrus ussuriensis x Pyrus communis]|uniref:Calmodulin-binding domain-containing protein n=1 Tax=Pyrus ussuriensis x Pyrus communis TaxID=2448454 RepID=A0A5N5G4H9_9ROSA|nr:hypothetical protein D8674_011500 [Pyrus ussuriensis x Pyrus communis]
MDDKELEFGAHLGSSQMCEKLSPSVLQNQNGGRQGELLLQKKKKKKLKKLTSIKLSKSPSLKPSRKRSSSISNHHVSSTDGSSDTSTENLQNSARTLTRRSSFKPAKNLTRISSLKFRNPLMRKCSGGTQMNNIDLKKSRMSKLASSACSNKSAMSTSDAESSSPRSVNLKPKTFSGHNSALNVPTKSMMTKHSELSKVPELRVQRATCSSTLKGSKLPEIGDHEAEGTESEGGSATKVCPFTYCSLHGHRHTNVPPLKRLISIRRRMLRAQRGVPRATQPLERVKGSGKTKEDQTNHMACNGNGAVHKTNALVSLPAVDGVGPDCCCIGTDVEATNTHWKEEKIAASNHNEGVQSTCTDDPSNSDPKLFRKNMEVDDCATVKLPNKLERPIPQEAVQSTRNNEISAASDSQASKEQNAGKEDQSGSKHAKDQKYTRMWQLMYKHAVKGVTPNVDDQLPLNGADKEEQLEGANTICEKNNLSFSEIDDHTAFVNHSAVGETTEICRHDAIELVQEAFDSILLPEIQDCSYGDESFSSGVSSDWEALEQTTDESGERRTSIATSRSSEDSTAQNTKEAKTASEVGERTDKKTPKSWSSLKKFILLKRFVKAVDKVRNLNYPKQKYLPLDPDSEAGKVNLRQQKTEERKNAEEWMLDYALQQVISKLPPAQQRRVALLVEAFETVLPFPEIKSSQRSNVTNSTESNIQVCNGLSVQSFIHQGEESNSRTSAGILLGNVSCPKKSFNEYPDQVIDFQMQEQQSQVIFYKLRTDHCFIQTTPDITVPETTGEDQKENQIVSVNACYRDDKVIDLTNFASSETKDPWLCDDTSLKRDEHGRVICDGLVSEAVQEASKEATSITSLELSNLASIGSTEEQMAAREEVGGVADEAWLEKQNYTNLWFLVYKHMASTIDAKDGDEPLEGAEEEQVDDANTLAEIDQEKSHHEDNKKVELHHIEAIKLQVEKAIDEIVLPENQDESDDDKSSTRGSSPEQEPPKNKVVIEGKSFMSKSTNSAKFGNATIQEENSVTEAEDKPAKKMSKNWSNLKKIILLNRFIKAMENVTKFNPQGPRYLPFEPDPEAEKVNLKHVNMDDRKNSEEWMLDYALQQAVARLTPARKRKVSLLVEAFETVIPTDGIPNPFKPQVAH